MNSRKLKKEIKEFCKKTNFYKISLVKKYLKKMWQEEQEVKNKIPIVTCSKCGSHKISIEYDDDEYSSDKWLYCNNCEEEFDDTVKYIDAKEELECLAWSDIIEVELYFEHPDIKSYAWQEKCEREIKRYLGMIKEQYPIF